MHNRHVLAFNLYIHVVMCKIFECEPSVQPINRINLPFLLWATNVIFKIMHIGSFFFTIWLNYIFACCLSLLNKQENVLICVTVGSGAC
jgi:hypothetical protein